jgi:hypothetical protein
MRAGALCGIWRTGWLVQGGGLDRRDAAASRGGTARRNVRILGKLSQKCFASKVNISI